MRALRDGGASVAFMNRSSYSVPPASRCRRRRAAPGFAGPGLTLAPRGGTLKTPATAGKITTRKVHPMARALDRIHVNSACGPRSTRVAENFSVARARGGSSRRWSCASSEENDAGRRARRRASTSRPIDVRCSVNLTPYGANWSPPRPGHPGRLLVSTPLPAARSSRRLVGRVVAPRRFGTGFRWLVGSRGSQPGRRHRHRRVGPLLVASMTHDPFVVALGALLQWLPPPGVRAACGALGPLDRRRIRRDRGPAARRGPGAPRALAIATDVASIALVLVAMFPLGTAEVFADNTTATLMRCSCGATTSRSPTFAADDRVHHGQPFRRSADRRRPVRRRSRRRSRPGRARRARPRCSSPRSSCRLHRRVRRADPTCDTTSPRRSVGGGQPPYAPLVPTIFVQHHLRRGRASHATAPGTGAIGFWWLAGRSRRRPGRHPFLKAGSPGGSASATSHGLVFETFTHLALHSLAPPGSRW